MTKPTSTPRVNTFRERQEALKRVPKQYYVTDDEHEYLKRQLEEYRNKNSDDITN